MAKSDLINSISILSKKIDSLLSEREMLIDRVKVLSEENKLLREYHNKDTLKINNALKDIEYLSLSHRLADSPEALVSARNNISELIRTIDSCIRLLRED